MFIKLIKMSLCLTAIALRAQFPVELAALRYVEIAKGTGAAAAAGKKFTEAQTSSRCLAICRPLGRFPLRSSAATYCRVSAINVRMG